MSKSKRIFKQYLLLVLNGYSMGAANVIPGVSGGTMAFILGIYEELIDSIKQFASVDTFKLIFKLKFKEIYNTLPWAFLLSIGIGVLLAIASLAKFLSYSLDKYPVITFAFFFGLIIASIFSVLKLVKKWSYGRFIALLAGAAFAYIIVTLVPVETPHVWWNIFLCGMIIICAMILPGISGSFLLLILGQYKFILNAVNIVITIPLLLLRGKELPDPDIIFNAILTLFWIIAGCIVGLGSFVHFLNWLFKKFHDLTVATLIGFMVGSLWKLWPWQRIDKVMVRAGDKVETFALPNQNIDFEKFQTTALSLGEKFKMKTLVTTNELPQTFDKTFWFAVTFAVVGFALVIIMEKMASGKATIDSGKVDN